MRKFGSAMLMTVLFWLGGGASAQDEVPPPYSPPSDGVQNPNPAPRQDVAPATPPSPAAPANLEPLKPESFESIPAGPGVPAPAEAQTEEAAAPSVSGTKNVPDTYVIQPGDTLWDICAKFLDNPWYWPKLWALNQYIENPHLIYPGNKLVFFAGSETAPPKLDIVSPAGEAAPAPETPEGTEAKEQPVTAAPAEGQRVLPTGQTLEDQRGFLAGRPKTDVTLKLKSIVMISEKKLKAAGVITHSGEMKDHLVFGDKAYLKFKDPKSVSLGDKFHVIGDLTKVSDPDSIFFGNLGTLVQKKGVVKVVAIHKNTIEAAIIDNDETISRGDRVIPYESPIRTVTPHTIDKEIMGEIVETENLQRAVAHNTYVFINRGKKHGIEDGVELRVIRRGDATRPGDDKKLPYVSVGKLLVVETHEKTATAYVLDQRYELTVGDVFSTRVPN